MSIKKQEFYEGAALHVLARTGVLTAIGYNPPFFLLNGTVSALLKYSTKGRSPWGFTFTSGEQALVDEESANRHTVLGLICGSDGVVSLDYNDFRTIVPKCEKAIRVSCSRSHGSHYEVAGPAGVLRRKISRSRWCNLKTGV